MLAARVASGAVFLVAARLLGRVIDFAALLILARLLTPADFGVVAAAMTLISVLEAILELPVGLVLLRMREPTSADYDTAFTLSVLRGGVLAAIVAIAAWPYASLFADPRLVTVVICLAWAPMIRGCASPRLTIYARDLQLGREFSAQIMGKIGGFVAAMVLVLTTRDYWALVGATMIGPTVMTVTSYLLAPYRPRYSLKEWRTFQAYLGWLSGAQLLSAISWQCDRLILGQLTSRAELGRYTMADSLSVMPTQALAIPASAILFPALGSIKEDRARLTRAFLMGTNAVYALCLPVMVGLIVLAEPICRIVLGPQWHDAAAPVQILTAAGIIALVSQPLGSLFHALGRTRTVMIRSLIALSIKVPMLVVGGLSFGLIGVAWARLAAECAVFAVSIRQIQLATDASCSNILRSLVRPFAGATSMALAIILIGSPSAVPATSTVQGLWLAATVVAGAIVYAGSIVGLWIVAGRPPGIEAKALHAANAVMQAVSRLIRNVRVRSKSFSAGERFAPSTTVLAPVPPKSERL